MHCVLWYTNVEMYFGSGTVAHTARQCCIVVKRGELEAFYEMTSWPPSYKYDVISVNLCVIDLSMKCTLRWRSFY